MKLLYRILTVVVLLCLAGAWAADSSPMHEPTIQGFESVNKNVAKNPDNKGLQNARNRLITNIVRHQTKDHPPHGKNGKANDAASSDRSAKLDRPNKVERVERVERAERVERPERVEKVERVERPEKPEKPQKVERPEKPEKPGKA